MQLCYKVHSMRNESVVLRKKVTQSSVSSFYEAIKLKHKLKHKTKKIDAV